jgi:DNA polymerase-3 subunit epsilon
MKRSNPIVFFDIETTGLSASNDRVVELYMLKKNPDGTEEEFYSRFNPLPVLVGKEAEDLHGLSNEVLAEEPKFKDKAQEVIDFMEGCDISGYNILGFDLPFLTEEFIRSGIDYSFSRPHTRGIRIFDVYKIWTELEPRTLKGATKRFLNKELNDAHRAKADVIATSEIFEAQLNIFSDLFDDLDELEEKTSKLKNSLDLSGKFSINEKHQIVITFGKHRDKTVQEIFREDSGYFLWISEKSDMSNEVKNIAKSIYEKLSAINANA